MIVLDTNVISEAGKREPDKSVRDWFEKQALDELYLCSPVIAELSFGAERILRRDGSSRYLKAIELLVESRFAGRILDFDTHCALLAGRIKADRETTGKPAPFMDCIIASICQAHGAALATRNIDDFVGLDLTLINPFEAG